MDAILLWDRFKGRWLRGTVIDTALSVTFLLFQRGPFEPDGGGSEIIASPQPTALLVEALPDAS